MKRRTALKNLVLATGSITLLSQCSFGEERLPIALNNLKVSTDQEDILKAVCSAIMPEGEVPGAAALEVHNFVWVMADDRLESEEQQQFLAGLNGLNPFLKDKKGESFENFEPAEQASVLSFVMGQKSIIPTQQEEAEPTYHLNDIQFFIATTKQFVIQGFMQSEYVMKNIMPYALVPTFFSGCETIDPSKRINING